MNITVFCGANYGNVPDFKEGAYKLGNWIGEKGYGLVFGGSSSGLMKEICDGALDKGAVVYGVEPEIDFLKEQMHPGVTNKIYTETLAERKTKMMELGDAYIALPGGLGTLDEITEIIELKKLGETDKPIILFDTLGYYNRLKDFFLNMISFGFLEEESKNIVLISDDIAEIESYISNSGK